ncbi:ISKra4 family transposase [Microvirga mediterraneensis]|uniref:ISKra4 family transposase n=1 Tax=Microvirga mediterraneensis TaxID=2754695 RepID=A0A838BV99_9HYPH|nr:ISKra4 family transposase [Microvirga mediterraneensis]MBA1159278.1 ISKra4 family transposase [Microvirga mediterraneensis]
MQVKIMLQIVADDGNIRTTEEVADLTKVTEGAEDLGLSLAESKALLAAAQQRIVEAQVNGWLATHRHCKVTGRKLRCKGSYPITFRTLFGDVQLKSPRFYVPKERQTNGPATISPLTQLLPDHIAPERLYLETRWASLVSYAAAADLLADVLPIGGGVNATTVRQHVLRAAERMEDDLAEQRTSFTEGTDPRDWEDLSVPEGRMVIGLDGGYIRDWRDRKRNFELIVGRSIPEEGEARYIGFVHGYDRKPQRRIIDHLRRQGFQADQDLTFITDGGEEVRTLAERISPCSEHVLDWFHITMRISVLRQFAQGLVRHDKDDGVAALDELRRIKWFLWHGNTYRAREAIDDLLLDLEALDSRYPNLRKFRTAMREFQIYIASNEPSLINYGERYRSGERISSAFVEATVNAVISKRFAKKQQMQWSRRGAHLLLQTRTKTLDGSLRAAFEHWYPGMMNDNAKDHGQAAA